MTAAELAKRWRDRSEWLKERAYPKERRGDPVFEAAYLEAARAADDFERLAGPGFPPSDARSVVEDTAG